MDASRILREFGVIFSKENNLSQLGGLELFLAFLEKGKFQERFESQFGKYRARTMMQFILGLVVGAKSMNDVGKVGHDALMNQFLPECVEEAQLGRDMRSFSRAMIESLHDLVMSYSILDFARRLGHGEKLIFDIDATSVEKFGYQEGVEHGYVGTAQPEGCYQYLLVRLANRNSFLYGTIRAGAAHSQNNFCGYLERFLPMLTEKWTNSWRGDSGYYNEQAFDLFTKHGATFFIKAPMTEDRLNRANISQDMLWSPPVDGISYASRMTMTGKKTYYREIFKRTLLQNEGQLSLGELSSYRYDCLVTNDLLMDEDKAFEFYNGRANIENGIRELKYDYQLGKIITDDFGANDVITQLTLLTYLLMSHFKNEVLPDNMKKMKLSTLRNQLFNIPGRLLSFARQQFTRIQNIFVGEEVYAKIFEKLRTLNTWVLAPPGV